MRFKNICIVELVNKWIVFINNIVRIDDGREQIIEFYFFWIIIHELV